MSGKPSEAVKPPANIVLENEMSIPHQLSRDETLQDLKKWDRLVQEYYKKDVNMYPFVSPGFCWDRSKKNFNLLDEHEDSELRRSAEEMAQDLDSFLHWLLTKYKKNDFNSPSQ